MREGRKGYQEKLSGGYGDTLSEVTGETIERLRGYLSRGYEENYLEVTGETKFRVNPYFFDSTLYAVLWVASLTKLMH